MRRPRLDLLLVFLLALAVRGVHLGQVSKTPLWDVPLGDGRQYAAWAEEIAGGDWIGREVFYQAPLYPYFMAVFGAKPGVLKIVQAVLGALAAVLLALAGERFFSRRAGLTAGVLLALYPPAIFFDGLVQKTSLALFLTAALLALLALRGRGAAAGVGAVLGLLALTRENALVLVPVALAWTLLRDGPRRERLVKAVLLAAGLAAVLLPVGLRNLAIGGRFLVTTSQLGPNFYIGNNPDADGRYRPLLPGRQDARVERRDATALAEADLGQELTPAEVSRHWLGRAGEWIGAEPLAWGRLLAQKAFLLVNAAEIVDTESLEAYRRVSPLLDLLARLVHFGVALPFAVLGLWTTRWRWRELWVLHAAALALAASLVAFYVMARYRVPLVAVALLFAAAGGVELFEAVRRRAWRPLAPGLVAAGLVAVLSNLPPGLPTSPVATTWYNLGVALLERGDDASARRWLAEAAELEPGVADVQWSLGRALLAGGDRTAAAERFAEAVRLDPGHAEAHAQLGFLRILEGRLDDAERHLERAVALDPAQALAWNLLGNVLAQEGRKDEAIARYEAALGADPGLADARFKLGLLLVEERRFAEARAHLEEAARLLPELPDVHLRLALVLEVQGERAAAATAYRRTLELRPDDPDAAAGLARTSG